MVVLETFAGLAVTGAGAAAVRSCRQHATGPDRGEKLVLSDGTRTPEASPRGASLRSAGAITPLQKRGAGVAKSSLNFSTETLLLAVPVALGCVLCREQPFAWSASSPLVSSDIAAQAGHLLISPGELAAGLGLAPLLGFLISRNSGASSPWASACVQVCGLAAAGYVSLALASRFGLHTVRRGALGLVCGAGIVSQVFFSGKKRETETPSAGHHGLPASPAHRAKTRGVSVSSASGSAIAVATRSGRFAEAYRELQRCEAAGVDVHELLDAQDIERVRRIGVVYEESLGMLRRQPRDYTSHEKNDAIGLEWGAELNDGKFITSTIIEQDMDFVRALGVHQEGRCERLFNPDVVSHEPLGEQHPYDTSWQKITHVRATGTKADDVLRKSVVDALDEPCRAVWFAEYTVPDAGHAGPVPPTRPGHYRMPYLRNVMMLQLLPAGRSGNPRVRQVQFIELTPKSAAYQVLRLTPTWLKKKMLRDVREEKLRLFVNFCRDSPELDEAMRDSPRVRLYEQLHQRLAQA